MPEGFTKQRKLLFDEVPSLTQLQKISDIFQSAYGDAYPQLMFTLDNLNLTAKMMLSFLLNNFDSQKYLLRKHFFQLKEIFTAYEVPVNDQLYHLAEKL